MKALELFAGYGGLALGAEAALDAETIAVAEWEAAPSRILEERFPDAPNLHDVTTADWSPWKGVDLISGGSPCQDVSGAGPRRGMHEGTRSGLWSSMRDAIAELEPEWVVWENVRGALSARATSLTPELEDEAEAQGAPRLRALGRVLGDLVSLGYDVQWRGVKASDVGAPHQRFRVFVLARKRTSLTATPPPSGVPVAIWSASRDVWKHMDPYLGEVANVYTKAFPTDGFVSAGIAYSLPKWAAEARPTMLPTPEASDATGARVASVMGGTRPSGAKRSVTIATAVHHGTSADGEATDWGRYAAAVERWEGVLGRPAPAPTEEGPKGGRRLSPAFVEWMMGLPAGWVTDPELGLSRSAQLKALGNGVVPLQAEAALADMKARFLASH